MQEANAAHEANEANEANVFPTSRRKVELGAKRTSGQEKLVRQEKKQKTGDQKLEVFLLKKKTKNRRNGKVRSYNKKEIKKRPSES